MSLQQSFALVYRLTIILITCVRVSYVPYPGWIAVECVPVPACLKIFTDPGIITQLNLEDIFR